MEPQRPLEQHQDIMGVPGEKREKWTEKKMFLKIQWHKISKI